MALEAATGAVQILASMTAGTTISVTSLTFQPTCIIVWYNNRNSASNTVSSSGSDFSGFGFAVSTTKRRCVSTQSIDGQPTSQCRRMGRDDSLIATVTSGGALDGAADLDAFLSNGFRVIIDDQFSSGFYFHYLALGGDLTSSLVDIVDTLAPSVAGDVTTSSLSFQPKALIGLRMGAAAVPYIAVNSHVGIGIASSTSEQAVLSYASDNNEAVSNTAHYCRMGEFVAAVDIPPTTVGNQAQITAISGSGFTLTYTSTVTSGVITSVLCLGAGSWSVKNSLTAIDATPFSITGVSFQPRCGLVISATAAEDTVDVVSAPAAYSIGGFGSEGQQVSATGLDDDNVDTTNANTGLAYDGCYANLDSTPSFEGRMAMDSLNSDGATFHMPDADPSPAFFAVLFGGTETAPPASSVTPAFFLRRRRAA